MNVTVALLQISPPGSHPDENLDRGLEAVRTAKSMGADIALFPEMWSVGYSDCPFDEDGKRAWEDQAIDHNSEYLRAFTGAASTEQIHIAVTYLGRGSPKPTNTVALLDDGGRVALEYDKVYICDFGKQELQSEHPDRTKIGSDFNCSPGRGFRVSEITIRNERLRVGALICSDREFPQAAWQLMKQGADLVLIPNSCTWDEARAAQLRTRAFDNLFAVAMSNYPPPKNNGRSSAFTCVAWDTEGRQQRVLVTEAPVDEGIYLATFDLAEVRNFREAEAWRLEYQRSWP